MIRLTVSPRQWISRSTSPPHALIRQQGLQRQRQVALVLAVGICLICATPAGAQTFIRGEVNGDGIVAVDDAIYLMNYLYFSGAAPENSCPDPFTFDSPDVNDNEYLTIADPLKLVDALFISGDFPPPYPSCGPDPSNQSQGFDTTDVDYTVTLAGPYDELDTSGISPQREARYELALEVPAAVRAVELYFGYDPAELTNPRYEGDEPLVLSEVAFGVLRLTLADALEPLEIGPGFDRIGAILFDVEPGVQLPELLWVPSFSDTFFRRATVVDDFLQDHHPQFVDLGISTFIRGDLDANGIRNLQDLVIWLAFYTTDSPHPVSACDFLPSEAADVNDNEYLTIADYLLLGNELFCGGAIDIPSPNNCGGDPNQFTGGFDELDPEYSLRATKFTLIGAGPVERDVEIPLRIISPTPVRAIQFSLDLGTPDLTLDTPFFEPAATLVDPVFQQRQEGSVLHVIIASTCDTVLPTGDANWQDLGILKLHLDGVELPAPIQWLPEATLGSSTYRASIVDDLFEDHHPTLLAGERIFQRGNTNNQGLASAIDFADPIWMLSYLTGSGPPPPCLDAGDANDDGRLDFADPIYLLNYLVGLLPVPPTPGIDCGFELDIDELDCQEYDCIP